jgi:phosphate/phosphite/phosphonate ABC transporter binding protein
MQTTEADAKLGELERTVRQAAGTSIAIDEADYEGTPYLPLVRALNGYGAGVKSLIGEAANKSNEMVLVSRSLMECARSVRDHATEQSEHTTQVATAVEEMSATISEIASTAAQTSEAAQAMAATSRQGEECVRATAGSIDEVSQLIGHVSEVMTRLKQASGEIGKIVRVINGIADQTNLLALNASIEAARAGEHGRGFAVVADEVRQLAASTKQSTEEIVGTVETNRRLTEEIASSMGEGQESVARSVEQAQQALTKLGEIGGEVDALEGRIQTVVSATEEQAAAVSEIARSVERVAQLSRDTQACAEVSYEAGSGLRQSACRLEERVERFDLPFFGAVPVKDAVEMNAQFEPLCRMLSQLLDVELVLRLGHDYDDAIKDVGTGRALLSYQTPSTYIEAHERHGVVPLVVPLSSGEPYYRSAVVVRADSGVDRLDQLAGRSVAFGDAKSTGSKAMPESMLRKAGVALNDLSGHAFVGSHDNVATAVLNKDYDAGGLMASTAEKYVGRGLKILATSDPIPQFPICASPKLTEDQRRLVTQALVGLDDRRVLEALGKKITGFARIEDRDYDPVREMLASLRR